jgi:type IV pilus assembly protein PilW
MMRERGFSLIELLVAVAISSVLVFGATQVYVDSRNTYATHEVEARLQETARYALSVIEPDIRMADYYGLVKGGGFVVNSATQAAAASPLVAGLATPCGNNFAVDLGSFIEGSNDAYNLGCPALNNRAVTSADTLTVRRASFATLDLTAAPPPAGAFVICSQRNQATVFRYPGPACPLVPNAGPPATIGTTQRAMGLVVDAYYVDQDSDQGANIPSLRRKWLGNNPATFNDLEIVSGIEDMQVQLGIENPAAGGTTTGIANQYVNVVQPAALPVGAQIVSVRIWIMVRADTPEIGFVDGRTYSYGNRNVANCVVNNLNAVAAAGCAYRPNDNFRRLLVSRTVMLRNSLGT